jgi:large subunit ribosomal protein L13
LEDKVKKTKFFNKVERNWILIDAKDQVLGRISTRIARILQGKHKATYSPNFLCGDRVVVINAAQMKITGKKLDQKVYDSYSGYPSGLKMKPLSTLMQKSPSKVLYIAVKGMLPKTLLAKRMIRGLKIYNDETHMQTAQQPVKVEV